MLNNNLSFTTGAVTGFKVNMSTVEGVVIEDGGNDGGNDGSDFVADYTINSLSYVQVSGSYNTHQWQVSTNNNNFSFRLYTPNSQGTELHVGTYQYYNGKGNTNGDFTFSVRNFSSYPVESNNSYMQVFKNGDTYTVNISVEYSNGLIQKYQYIGAL